MPFAGSCSLRVFCILLGGFCAALNDEDAICQLDDSLALLQQTTKLKRRRLDADMYATAPLSLNEMRVRPSAIQDTPYEDVDVVDDAQATSDDAWLYEPAMVMSGDTPAAQTEGVPGTNDPAMDPELALISGGYSDASKQVPSSTYTSDQGFLGDDFSSRDPSLMPDQNVAMVGDSWDRSSRKNANIETGILKSLSQMGQRSSANPRGMLDELGSENGLDSLNSILKNLRRVEDESRRMSDSVDLSSNQMLSQNLALEVGGSGTSPPADISKKGFERLQARLNKAEEENNGWDAVLQKLSQTSATGPESESDLDKRSDALLENLIHNKEDAENSLSIKSGASADDADLKISRKHGITKANPNSANEPQSLNVDKVLDGIARALPTDEASIDKLARSLVSSEKTPDRRPQLVPHRRELVSENSEEDYNDEEPDDFEKILNDLAADEKPHRTSSENSAEDLISIPDISVLPSVDSEMIEGDSQLGADQIRKFSMKALESLNKIVHLA
jgi:hypothetical protein